MADSDANFVLFGEFDDAHAIWQALLDRGVLIREVGPPAGCGSPSGTPEEMTRSEAGRWTEVRVS